MSVKERIKEIRALPSEELDVEIQKIRDKVFKMRFQGKGKDLENSGQLKASRKDIARIHTVLSERARASSKVKAASRVPGGTA